MAKPVLLVEAQNYHELVRKTLRHQPKKHNEFIKVLKDFTQKKIDHSSLISTVKKLFDGYDELLSGFYIFLPDSSATPFTIPNSSSIQEAQTYIELVKQTLSNQPEKHQEFAEALKDFAAQKIDISLFVSTVKNLFDGYDDLLSGLNTFLPENICPIPVPSPKSIRRALFQKSAMGFINKVRERFLIDNGMYKSFLDVLRSCRIGDNDIIQVEKTIRVMFKDHPDLYAEFKRFYPCFTEEETTTSSSSITEYVLDTNKDSCFTKTGHNLSNKILFDCEDKMCEVDILLHRFESTKAAVQELLEESSLNQEKEINIEDYLTVLNLRCIEILYGEHGPDVVDLLRENPSFIASIIRPRLDQKHEELVTFRDEFKVVFANRIKECHEKTLKYQKFNYVRNEDARSVSPISTLNPVEEIDGEKQQEDDKVPMDVCL